MVYQLRRWLPDKALVVTGDNAYSALEFLHECQSLTQPVTIITRLRLDAALYESAPVRKAKQNGRPRLKDKRLRVHFKKVSIRQRQPNSHRKNGQGRQHE